MNQESTPIFSLFFQLQTGDYRRSRFRMLVFKPQTAKNIFKVRQPVGSTVALLGPFCRRCREESTLAALKAHRVSRLLCLAPEGQGETAAAHHSPREQGGNDDEQALHCPSTVFSRKKQMMQINHTGSQLNVVSSKDRFPTNLQTAPKGLQRGRFFVY